MEIKFKTIIPKKSDLEKQVWDSYRKQLESKIKNIKCPEHHEHPCVIVSGSLKKPKYKIEGCCQTLVNKANEALK